MVNMIASNSINNKSMFNCDFNNSNQHEIHNTLNEYSSNACGRFLGLGKWKEKDREETRVRGVGRRRGRRRITEV